MDEKCQFYKKAEYFICELPNLDSDKAKLEVRCEGDINMCDNLEEYIVCTKSGWDTPK